MKDDSFVFYPSFIQQIEAIRNDSIKLRLYQATTGYGCYGSVPDFSDIDSLGTLDSLFLGLKRAIDDSKKRRETQRKNGAKGGAPIGNTNARKYPKTTQNNPKTTQNNPDTTQNNPDTTQNNLNVDVDVDVDVDGNGNVERGRCTKPQKRFVPPSLDEVKKFFLENGFTSDAEAFFDYYEANGWTQGNRKPLKKWEAAARQWERRQLEFTNSRPGSKPTPPPKPAPTAPADEPTDFGGVMY